MTTFSTSSLSHLSHQIQNNISLFSQKLSYHQQQHTQHTSSSRHIASSNDTTADDAEMMTSSQAQQQHLKTLQLISSYIQILSETTTNSASSASTTTTTPDATQKQITSNIHHHIYHLLQQERQENVILRQRIYQWIRDEDLVPPVGYSFHFKVGDKLKNCVKDIEAFCLKKTKERVLSAFQLGKDSSSSAATALDRPKLTEINEGREFTEMLDALDEFKAQTVQLVEQCEHYTHTCKQRFRAQAADLIGFNELLKVKYTSFAAENMRMQREMQIMSQEQLRMQRRVDRLMNENSLFRHQIDELHEKLSVNNLARSKRLQASSHGNGRETPERSFSMSRPSSVSRGSSPRGGGGGDVSDRRPASAAATSWKRGSRKAMPSRSTSALERSPIPLAQRFMKRSRSAASKRRSPSPSPAVEKMKKSRRERILQQQELKRETSHSQLLFDPPSGGAKQKQRAHSSLGGGGGGGKGEESPRLFSKEEKLGDWEKTESQSPKRVEPKKRRSFSSMR